MRFGLVLTGGMMLWAQGAFAEYGTCVGLSANRQPVEVIEACTAALETELSDDELAEALAARGVAWRQLGENGKSLRDLRRAKHLEPSHNTQRMLAWTWHELGYDKTAEWLYTRVLKEAPTMQGYLSRCVVRQELGKDELAVEDCGAAMELDSESEDVTYFYARALNIVERPQDALVVAERGLEFHAKTSARLYTQKAIALVGLRRIDEAMATAEAAQKRFPADEGLAKFLTLSKEW
ncbi:tetratricopeptide repeat protein [Celeribacter sp.]|uniref:tetratricopeptide repeat protein n=1 Tax=Celeribacter sp. TaxID=1890673 RepID=UPI003A8F9754